MADTRIIFPRHSFVNDSSVDGIGASCGKDTFCLPMAVLSDWKFQALIADYGDLVDEQANFRYFYAALIKDNEVCNGQIPFQNGSLFNGKIFYPSRIVAKHGNFSVAPVEMADGQIVKGVLNFDWNNNTDQYPVLSNSNQIQYSYYEMLNDHDEATQIDTAIAVGECFRLAIIEDIVAEDTEDLVLKRTVLACTNCFVKVETDCFYSRFVYYNNEDSHGFLYKYSTHLPFANCGLLPFHLHSPSFPSEEKSYVKSNGSHLKLYERTDEQLILETDYFDMRVHKCMKVMLGSDNISLNNDYFNPRESVNVVCKESYDIEWPRIGQKVMRLAKATTKVISQQPISLINNNCK